MDKFSNFSYGGYFTAPQFDLSFVRLLSQKGRAKIASAGTLTVVNNYLGSYNVRISPQFQNIAKDANDRTAVVTGANADFALTVTRPIICWEFSTRRRRLNRPSASRSCQISRILNICSEQPHPLIRIQNCM